MFEALKMAALAVAMVAGAVAFVWVMLLKGGTLFRRLERAKFTREVAAIPVREGIKPELPTAASLAEPRKVLTDLEWDGLIAHRIETVALAEGWSLSVNFYKDGSTKRRLRAISPRLVARLADARLPESHRLESLKLKGTPETFIEASRQEALHLVADAMSIIGGVEPVEPAQTFEADLRAAEGVDQVEAAEAQPQRAKPGRRNSTVPADSPKPSPAVVGKVVWAALESNADVPEGVFTVIIEPADGGDAQTLRGVALQEAFESMGIQTDDHVSITRRGQEPVVVMEKGVRKQVLRNKFEVVKMTEETA